MNRLHLFELEDQAWLPITFRNLLTDNLEFITTKFRLYEPTIPLIKKVLEHMNENQVIDLCSGSSGPWKQLIDDEWNITVKLTDKFPNLGAFKRAVNESSGQIDFISESIDASNVPSHLKGTRTMFSGFHHFKPPEAKAILQDVVKHQTAIGIFEFTERRLHNLLLAPIKIPLLAFLSTPFIKPITFTRLFWTYCIPIMPILLFWDGFVSRLRTYSVQELGELTNSIKCNGYKWETGQLEAPELKITITYLIGYPED